MKLLVITKREREENFNSTAKSIKLKGKKLKKQRDLPLHEGEVKRDRQGRPILWY